MNKSTSPLIPLLAKEREIYSLLLFLGEGLGMR
jgi:hypothetical protein